MNSIEGIRKVFKGKPPKVAVRDMWLGIPKGQCFGYLGSNGAGESVFLIIDCSTSS